MRDRILLGVELEGVVLLVAIREGGIRRRTPTSEARRRARRRQQTKRYRVSEQKRKLIEERFGWCKTIGGLRRSRHIGRWKLGQQALVTAAAYNLLRMTASFEGAVSLSPTKYGRTGPLGRAQDANTAQNQPSNG